MSLHGIRRRAEELLDAKMLFDPLEKGFDVPAAAVEIGDRFCRLHKVVCEKDERFVALGIEEADATEFFRVILFGVETAEGNDLVASDSGGLVDRQRYEAMKMKVVLCPDYKECLGLMYAKEALEVRVTTIHDIDGARLDEQLVENVDIVHLAVGDDYHGRNGATQIEERMQFDCGLRFSEMRPREDRKTKVDGARVQRIGRLLECQAEIVVDVQSSSLCDQHLSKVGVDAPIPNLICIGQSVSGHPATDAHVIELAPGNTQARLNVAQTLAVRQLRKGHAAELIAA